MGIPEIELDDTSPFPQTAILHAHQFTPEARLDYFRGQALAGLLANPDTRQRWRDSMARTGESLFSDWLAADADLCARAAVALPENILLSSAAHRNGCVSSRARLAAVAFFLPASIFGGALSMVSRTD